MQVSNMKKETGRLSLQELAAELDRQRRVKKDFLADTRGLKVVPDDTGLALVIPDAIKDSVEADTCRIRRHALRQIGSRLNIPATFVDRLAEKHPDMLAWNVNQLFEREPEHRMIRTLDGNVRAFLSNSYRPLDNYDLAEAVLPRLIKLEAEVFSCSVTETRMYIKALIPGVAREVKADGVFFGDGGHNQIHVLKPGTIISNSEVGAGSLTVQPGIHEVHCSNLAVFRQDAMRKFHVGRRQDIEATWEVLSDDTRRVTDRAFWMQIQDLVGASLEGSLFEKMVEKCEEAIHGPKIDKPIEAVKMLTELNSSEQDGILNTLIRSADFSQFGLQAAVTRYAQDVECPDRQVELEQLGGKIIELPRSEWQHIAAAA